MKTIWIYFFFIPFIAFGSSMGSENGTDEILDLVSLGLKTVHNFSGFVCNFGLVNGKPDGLISFSYVDINKSSDDVTNSILIVRSGLSSADQSVVINELKETPNIKYTLVKEANNLSENDNCDVDGTKRFNFYDSAGIKRMTKWLEKSNGITVKTTYFDENEILIGETFIADLKVNEGRKNYKGHGNPFILRLNKTKHHQNLNLRSVQELDDFVSDLLSKVRESN